MKYTDSEAIGSTATEENALDAASRKSKNRLCRI